MLTSRHHSLFFCETREFRGSRRDLFRDNGPRARVDAFFSHDMITVVVYMCYLRSQSRMRTPDPCA